MPGRERERAREMAQRTGLKIVLGSGWYREPYYGPYLWHASNNQIAEEIVVEVTDGIEGTDVRAGLIGEMAPTPTTHCRWKREFFEPPRGPNLRPISRSRRTNPRARSHWSR